MMLARNYIPCLKCDSIVSENFKEIHEINCHKLSMSNFAHPFIKIEEGCMTAQSVKITDDFETVYDNISSKEKTGILLKQIVKPGWTKGIKKTFARHFVFLNEADMFLCNFVSFSLVIVSNGKSEALFIPVPNEDIPPLTILIYESGLLKFQSYELGALFSVKRLDNIKIAKEITLTLDSPVIVVKPSLIDMCVRNFHSRFPNIFRKGETYHISKAINLTVTNINEKNDNKLDKIKRYYQSPKINGSMQYFTYDEWNNSQIKASKKCNIHVENITTNLNKLDLDQVNGCLTSNRPMLNATSSPISLSSKIDAKRRRSKKKINKNIFNKSQDLNLSTGKSCTASNYFQLSEDALMKIIGENCKNSLLSSDSRLPYYRDEIYNYVASLITKKAQHVSESKLALCNLWNGILISGHSGTGKTSLVNELCSNLNLPLITVSLSEWSKSRLSESDYMVHVYDNAKEKAPSVLFFDEIDSLCIEGSKKNEGFPSLIFKIFSEVKKLPTTVLLICATNRPEEVSLKLLESGRFDKEIVLSLPNDKKKCHILWYLVSHHNSSITMEDIKDIAKLTKGFSAADLESLVRRALSISFKKWEVAVSKSERAILSFDDLKDSVSAIVPSFLRQNYTAVNEVYWSDIFGYESIKKQIKEKLLCTNDGSYDLKGLLLFGPPGCSKTMIVRAIATEAKFTFFPIKCADLLSKYVGETERSLCSIFKRASMSAPSLIFMDEIDSLCGVRNEQGCFEAGIITELLSLIKKYTNGGVTMVVGATNRPQDIDEALLSPGCLESILYIDLPDFSSRLDIWNGLLLGVPTTGIDIQFLCNKTEGFSGAEITYIYQKAVQRLMANCTNEVNLNADDVSLTQHDFLVVLENMQPRTSPTVLETNREFYLARKGLSIGNKS